MNRFIVNFIQSQGCEAMGLHTLASVVLFGQKTTLRGGGRRLDLGFVGEVTSVNARLLHLLVQADSVPVIASMAQDPAGGPLNVNGDTAAGAVAAAMKADKLVVDLRYAWHSAGCEGSVDAGESYHARADR